MAAIPTRDEWKKMRTVPQGAVSGVSMGKAFEDYGKAKQDPESQVAALKKLSEATGKYLAGVKKKFAGQKPHAQMIVKFEDIHKSILQLITINKAKVNPRKAVDVAIKSARALVGKVTKDKLDKLYQEELRGIGLPSKMWIKSESTKASVLEPFEQAANKWKFNVEDNIAAEQLLTQIMLDLGDLDQALTKEGV